MAGFFIKRLLLKQSYYYIVTPHISRCRERHVHAPYHVLGHGKKKNKFKYLKEYNKQAKLNGLNVKIKQ